MKPKAFRDDQYGGMWHVTDGENSGVAHELEDAYKAYEDAKAESEVLCTK